MGKRPRWAFVSGVGFCLAGVVLLLADSSVGLTLCPLTSSSCPGRAEVAMDADFNPTKLPKKKLAPIHFRLDGTIGMSDGSNPPPLRELVLEIDRNAALDAQGLPVCGLGKIKGVTTSQALKACTPALVGEGKTNVEVAYSEQSPLLPWSRLLAFYGGVRGGKETIYIHAYLVAPVSAPVVMTARVSKIPKGRFGTKLAISIPPIAKGSGFVKEFQLELFRRFAYRHKKQSFLKARCFDGKLQVRATWSLSEGSPVAGIFLLPCTAKG